MTERPAHLCKKSFLLALAAIAIAALPAYGQTLSAQPSFAVATIKPNKSGYTGGGYLFFPGGTYEAHNLTVKDLIREAYGIEYSSTDRVYGGPSWANTARFDIQAKADDSTAAQWDKIPGSERKQMLQSLLADRFKLTVHHETRELPVYILTVAKNGPKLTPSAKPLPPADNNPTYAFGARLPTQSNKGSWHGLRRLGIGQINAMHATTAMLTESFLPDQPEIGGRGVLDKTGLPGDYDFTLHWLPESDSNSNHDRGMKPADATWPPLFTALQEQLGLKLESAKGPLDIIVIDSVTTPSEN